MDENFSFDLPELNNLPSFNNGEEDPNIEKIYEYLNSDLERDEILIEKLKEFEKRLDEYLDKEIYLDKETG